MSDEGSAGSGRPPEERELAGYLDELIYASLSQLTPDAQQLPSLPPDPQPSPDDAQPGRAQEAPTEARPDAEVGGVRRASMCDELLALFRDTEKTAAGPDSTMAASVAAVADSQGANLSASAAPTQSVFLQRFLRHAPYAADLPSSGIPDLDGRLGGGLAPGLHLLAGPPGEIKTAFMLSAAWEALSAQRPAVYFALREGSLRAWMRLVATLASFQENQEDSTLTLTRLRAGGLAPEQLASLSRVDRLLQALVLPLLSLVDTIPTRLATMDAFAEDVRAKSREVSQRHGRVPLVLVDDLDRLLLLAPEPRLVHVLALLDEVLQNECVPGLVGFTLTESLLEAADALPAQTVLALEPAMDNLENSFGRASLQVLADAPTGWTGTVPLLLDIPSGLFALDPTSPQGTQERVPSDLGTTSPPSLPFSC
jgi:hypothetical protein